VRVGGDRSGPAHRFLERDTEVRLHLPAAAALRHELPLVTADAEAFGRVPGLEVVDHREG